MSHWITAFFRTRTYRRKRVRRVSSASKKHYQLHKMEALVLVQKLLEQHNQRYGFTYHRVTVRNQITRWGSCSRQGNLNFNYKILFLPEPLQAYIVVHELCHLKELNHSKNFWLLVAQTLPEYINLRYQLKKVSCRSLPRLNDLSGAVQTKR